MKKIFSLAILIYLISGISHGIYSNNIDLLNLSEKQSQIEWLLRSFRDVGIIVAASCAIILSFLNYAESQNKLKAKFWVILSVSFCLSLSAASYLMYKQSEQLLLIMKTPTIFIEPDKIKSYEKQIISNKYSLREKIKLSKSIASNTYIESGKILNIINKKGMLSPYEPSVKDIEKYNKSLHMIKIQEHTLTSLKYSVILWLVVLFISIITGIISYQRKIAYNKSFKLTPKSGAV